MVNARRTQGRPLTHKDIHKGNLTIRQADGQSFPLHNQAIILVRKEWRRTQGRQRRTGAAESHAFCRPVYPHPRGNSCHQVANFDGFMP